MFLNNISGSELVTLASTLSIYISKDLTPDDLAKLGSFFTTLGDNLSLISIQVDSNNKSKKFNL